MLYTATISIESTGTYLILNTEPAMKYPHTNAVELLYSIFRNYYSSIACIRVVSSYILYSDSSRFSTDTDSFPEDLKTLRPDLFFLVLLPP